MRFSSEAFRCNCDGQHGGTRGMTFGPNKEFSNKYRRLVIMSSVTMQRGCLDWNTCAHIPERGLRCVTWNTRGLLGSPSSSQSSRERKHNCFIRLTRSNDIISLQEIHGKDEVLQAIQVLAPRFKLHGTFIYLYVSTRTSCLVKQW